jgi:hypothetical protein
MNLQSSQPLWTELLTDVSSPDLIWQCGVVVLCILIGWALARLIMPAFTEHGAGLISKSEK